MPSSSFDDFVAERIANAPVDELLMLAAAREAIIAKDDNYPADKEGANMNDPRPVCGATDKGHVCLMPANHVGSCEAAIVVDGVIVRWHRWWKA